MNGRYFNGDISRRRLLGESANSPLVAPADDGLAKRDFASRPEWMAAVESPISED